MNSEYKVLQQLPNILYHGTTSENNQYLTLKDIGKIDLSYGDKHNDFGQGFYLTSIYEQALNFARRRTNVINKDVSTTNFPVIIKYNLDVDKLNVCRGRIFIKPDNEWAEFIYNNRVRYDNKLISILHNRNKQYEYVYGNLADGNLGNIMKHWGSAKKFDIDKFTSQIFPMFPDNNNQLSLHTVNALQCLSFLEIMTDEQYDKNHKKR